MTKKTINRLAVILVGEFRTWKIASKYLFQFFEERAVQVDYFFATWNVSSQTGELIPVTDNDIVDPFNQYNQNLISYKILEPIGRHRTTFYNQAWLSKVGNLLKRKYEAQNDFVYDQVIETRPDCYFRRRETIWEMVKDFEHEGGVHRRFVSGLLGIHDVYFRTTSITNDIISDRYYYKHSKDLTKIINNIHWEFKNHHLVLSELYHKRLINSKSNVDQNDYKLFVCIRPNFPTDQNLDDINVDDLDKLFISYVKQDDKFFYGANSDMPRVDD